MKQHLVCIQKGKGGLKWYKYWTGGIVLKSKKAIRHAIELKLRVLRQDKITRRVEKFNYKTKTFEDLK